MGIPGIEPGVGFPDGVTVRSRTLRGDAQTLVATFGNDPNHRPYESQASTCCVAMNIGGQVWLRSTPFAGRVLQTRCRNHLLYLPIGVPTR